MKLNFWGKWFLFVVKAIKIISTFPVKKLPLRVLLVYVSKSILASDNTKLLAKRFLFSLAKFVWIFYFLGCYNNLGWQFSIFEVNGAIFWAVDIFKTDNTSIFLAFLDFIYIFFCSFWMFFPEQRLDCLEEHHGQRKGTNPKPQRPTIQAKLFWI